MLYVLISLLILLIAYVFIHQKYEKYASEHSRAILSLFFVNRRYVFHEIPPCTLSHCYDNETYYRMISTWDYLVYQLVYIKQDVINGITKAAENATRYASYRAEIDGIDTFGTYDDERKILFRKWLLRIEKNIFRKFVYCPETSYCIWVTLYLTNINRVGKRRKEHCFTAEQITYILQKLEQKSGDYYLDNDIWQSISIVERGKVSNKMRFAIYARDGYRCRKCGRSTKDLEIDHIFPIAKGGKTVYDNLQTLCHRCNALKSDKVEFGTINPATKSHDLQRKCPDCGAPLIRRRGTNGYFYGCSNYPGCRHTENM